MWLMEDAQERYLVWVQLVMNVHNMSGVMSIDTFAPFALSSLCLVWLISFLWNKHSAKGS